jgi:hypothetical protein
MAQSPPGDDDERITRPFESRPYDPVSGREKIRGRLAQILIWAVIALSVGALGLLAIGRITVQDLPSFRASSHRHWQGSPARRSASISG